MRIIINASNIGYGGGAQVTSSICEGLGVFNNHTFIVVLSKAVSQIKTIFYDIPNVEVIEHSISRSKLTKITGRERFLDELVYSRSIDCVLSVFGPTWWVPKCPHLCGFALAHVVMPESPYFTRMDFKNKIKSRLDVAIMRYFFKKSSDCFYTENEMISERLRHLFKNAKVYTVTNYYNQVYDKPERWKEKKIPSFAGKTFVTLAAAYPHKNLEIAIGISHYLKRHYPDFQFRFVFSIDKKDFPQLEEKIKDCFVFIGRVTIDECPLLYQQADVVFQPTLLECFTAAYPEAMRMERPIVTTDLNFAHGLCDQAAVYYSPLSEEDAAESLYRVSTNHVIAENLIQNGLEQLKKFDNYTQRVNKLISICESLV